MTNRGGAVGGATTPADARKPTVVKATYGNRRSLTPLVRPPEADALWDQLVQESAAQSDDGGGGTSSSDSEVDEILAAADANGYKAAATPSATPAAGGKPVAGASVTKKSKRAGVAKGKTATAATPAAGKKAATQRGATPATGKKPPAADAPKNSLAADAARKPLPDEAPAPASAPPASSPKRDAVAVRTSPRRTPAGARTPAAPSAFSVMMAASAARSAARAKQEGAQAKTPSERVRPSTAATATPTSTSSTSSQPVPTVELPSSVVLTSPVESLPSTTPRRSPRRTPATAADASAPAGATSPVARTLWAEARQRDLASSASAADGTHPLSSSPQVDRTLSSPDGLAKRARSPSPTPARSPSRSPAKRTPLASRGDGEGAGDDGIVASASQATPTAATGQRTGARPYTPGTAMAVAARLAANAGSASAGRSLPRSSGMFMSLGGASGSATRPSPRPLAATRGRASTGTSPAVPRRPADDGAATGRTFEEKLAALTAGLPLVSDVSGRTNESSDDDDGDDGDGDDDDDDKNRSSSDSETEHAAATAAGAGNGKLSAASSVARTSKPPSAAASPARVGDRLRSPLRLTARAAAPLAPADASEPSPSPSPSPSPAPASSVAAVAPSSSLATDASAEERPSYAWRAFDDSDDDGGVGSDAERREADRARSAGPASIKTSFELQEAGNVKKFLDQCDYWLDDLAPSMPAALVASSAVKLAEKAGNATELSLLKSHQLVRRLYDALRANLARHPVRWRCGGYGLGQGRTG